MLFTIPAGKHRAKPLKFGLYFRKHFKWVVRFDQTAKYFIYPGFPAPFNKDNAGPQLDINKLCGIRFLLGDHSARFGWRYNPLYPEQVEILAYTHDDSNGYDRINVSEEEKVIGRTFFNQNIRLAIKMEKGFYWFSMNGKDTKLTKSHSQGISYRQGLYFGGRSTAPHEIRVQINSVK